MKVPIACSRARGCALLAGLLCGASTFFVQAQRKTAFTPHEKAYYADPAVVAFVQPGLVVKVVSATIASDASAFAHAAANTDTKFGENCDVWHGTGAAFETTQVHAGH
jgi:hypothetical protein